MIGIERSWQQCAGALPKPRQVFVTASRVLAEKVQEVFNKLHTSLLLADGATAVFPNTAPTSDTNEMCEDLLDDGHDGEYRDNLPKRYSELTDAHFPLFLTFDRVRDPDIVGIQRCQADLFGSSVNWWKLSCRLRCPPRRTLALSFSLMTKCLTTA